MDWVDTIGATAVTLLLGFMIFMIGASVFGWHRETGEGSHTGYVTAVQKTGLFFKTYDVYVKTDLASSQEDKYCVIDTEVANQLRDIAEESTKVKLNYITYFATGVTSCSGEYDIITSFEVKY